MTIEELTKALEDKIQSITMSNVHERAGLLVALSLIKGEDN